MDYETCLKVFHDLTRCALELAIVSCAFAIPYAFWRLVTNSNNGR